MHKVIILQARLSSSRLPKKVLADLSGKSVVAHVIDRLRAAKLADEVCVAIPTDAVEDELAAALADSGVTIVRGSQHDVLGRFIQAAYQTRADVIVRTTADNALVSFEEIDRQLAALEADPELEYLITAGYPMGITPETFTLKALEKLDYLARHAHMREHVTLYIRENPGPFNAKTLKAPPELSEPDLRLTIDTAEDLELLREVYRRLYEPGRPIELSDVLELVRAEPALERLCRQPVILPASA